MYTALYRAQRPEVFSEILGQEHIVRILKHQIETDSVNHAYLFCGTRGTGKTTTARLLAKAVNCLDEGERPCGTCANCQAIKNGSFMDVVEIDAASNNGVDNIRELRESVKYPPVIGRKKIYIIDEVHMLSPGAFNALLKTLEEPPENVMFILATTEPQKLPQTILSRCMRLDFKRVPLTTLAEGFGRICRDKGVNISEGALRLVANAADGSVRDGLSILDQVLASGEKEIDRDQVLEYMGAVGDEFFIRLTELVSLKKVSEALVLLNEALSDGKDVKQLMKDWTAHYRNLLVTKFIKSPEDMLNMSSENIEKIREQSQRISLEEINDAIIRLSKTINDARWSTQPRILLELAIVSIATGLIDDKPLMPKTRTASADVQPQNAGSARTVAAVSRPQPAAKPEMPQNPNDLFVEEENFDSIDFNPAELFAADSDNAAPQSRPSAGRPAAAQKPVQSHGQNPAGNAPKTVGGRTLRSIMSEEELLSLWRDVIEDGEDDAGSFGLVRNGTELIAVDENSFTILAKNSFTRKYIEEQERSARIVDLMAKHAGRYMKLQCVLQGEAVVEQVVTDAAESAQAISDILGIKVNIE